MRREQTYKSIKELEQLENRINQNPFLKNQWDLGNIDTFINLVGKAYVETNIPHKIIIEDDIDHSQWKAKLHYHYKKEDIIHDKNTYIGYRLNTTT